MATATRTTRTSCREMDEVPIDMGLDKGISLGEGALAAWHQCFESLR